MFKTTTLLLVSLLFTACTTFDKSKRVFKDPTTKPTLEQIELIGEELTSSLNIQELEKMTKVEVSLSDDKPLYIGANSEFEVVARVTDFDSKTSAQVKQVKFRFNNKRKVTLRDVEVVFGKSSVRSLGPSTLLNLALPQKEMAEKLEAIVHVKGSGENLDEPILSLLIRKKDVL